MADSAELRDAVGELQQYFSDRLAPLMIADSMALLLHYPAALLAPHVGAWVADQQTSTPNLSISDLLYHAAKKVALMGEFELVPTEGLRNYVTELAGELLAYCPDGDRDGLAENFERLGQLSTLAGGVGGGTLHVIHRAGVKDETGGEKAPAPRGPEPPRAPAAGSAESQADVTRGLKRLSLLLERLQPQMPTEQRTEAASQFVATAVTQAQTPRELEEHLAPLRQYGIEPAMDQIFRTLARTLPGWGNLEAPGSTAPPALVGAQVNAMRQIVSLVDDPAEGASRFRQLVQAAVEQFNEGHLGRAVTMFELAERLVSDQKAQGPLVEAQRAGHEAISADRLRKLADRADTRGTLRPILNFYYALRPEGLLHQLDGEPRRERRHELLALLEAHGVSARNIAYDMLRSSVEDREAQVDPYLQMNLVYLLRVITRPEETPLDEEIGLVMGTSGRDSPPPLVKQVIAYLAAVRHDKAERALITYLRVFENMLLQPDTAVYSPAEVETLLDRTCTALARYATPRAWRALVDHGLKTEVRLGSPTARLVEAGKQDLSSTPELIDRLIGALKAELPKQVLGFTVKRNDDRISWLVQALGGTPSDQVRATLQDIVDRFPGEKFSEVAGRALGTLGLPPKASTPASLAGDLELFGLPSLLQTLGQSQLTGMLNIMSGTGKTEATILLESGQFRGAQYGPIRGARAVYQLFERPFPGTFAFVNRPEIASLNPNSPARDIVGIILEGVRRHDEYKRAAALVPDSASLALTDTPPSALPDEEPDLIRAVWTHVGGGGSPLQCEGAVSVDGYHVRRLLAHWVEEGALEVA